jgi:hypothetical protein
VIIGVALSLLGVGIRMPFDEESLPVTASQGTSEKEARELSESVIRQQPHENADASERRTAVPPGQAGQRIYIDPTTGRFIEPPPDVLAAEALAAQADPLNFEMSTSDVGLVEAPLAGGGSMVDLQGRFRSALVATVGSDGKLAIGHQPIEPVPGDKK